MQNELIPPPALAPPSVKHLPPEKCLQLWEELIDECEAFLIAGMQTKVGPDGDWKTIYRQWYARHMEDHERTQIRLLENLSRRESRHGG